jgi:ribosomal protein L32
MRKITALEEGIVCVKSGLRNLVVGTTEVEEALGSDAPELADLREILQQLKKFQLRLESRIVRCSNCGDIYRIGDPSRPIGELTGSHGVCPECFAEWERAMGTADEDISADVRYDAAKDARLEESGFDGIPLGWRPEND